ncbi:MAG: aminopeptidase [Verrucomicrobiota bacterium]
MTRRKEIGLATLGVCVVLVVGCQTTWYGQALRGQIEVMSATQPCDEIIADPNTPDDLRQRLLLVAEILEFAENDLQLPNGGNYTTYADLGRDAVLWAVFATKSLEVEAKEWSYPIVGALGYRGYFREEDAEALAEKLDDKGLDVAVVPVPAYSTLGWMRDPVLNTFIDYKDADLAALIFHELMHRKYYRPGDTEFSEALAVAIEQEGVERWLTSKGDTAGLAKYHQQEAKLMRFVQRLLDTRAELGELFETDLSDDEKLAKKSELLGGLQKEIRELMRAAGKTEEDTFWLRDEINNAHLNIAAAYFLRVPEFQEALENVGGDLTQFYVNLDEMR